MVFYANRGEKSRISHIKTLTGFKSINPYFKRDYIKMNRTDSLSLPGKQLSIKAFKSCISESEKVQTVSLEEAKLKWAYKKHEIQKLISFRISC